MNRGTWHGLGEDKEFSFLAVVTLVCYLSLELCVGTKAGRRRVQEALFSNGCLANSTGVVEAI